MKRSELATAATVLVVLVASGCAGSSGGPTVGPSAASIVVPTSSAAASPSPMDLTAARAAQAFSGVAAPKGYRADVRCPPRTASDKRICSQPNPASVVWVTSLTYLGPDLPRASGVQAEILLNLTRAKSGDAADVLYQRRLRELQARAGRHENPLTRQGGTYTPGRRGQGTLRPSTSRGWSGVDLQETYVIVFDDATSGTVAAGSRIERQGAYLLDVSWTAADARTKVELGDLADRVVAALEQVR